MRVQAVEREEKIPRGMRGLVASRASMTRKSISAKAPERSSERTRADDHEAEVPPNSRPSRRRQVPVRRAKKPGQSRRERPFKRGVRGVGRRRR